MLEPAILAAHPDSVLSDATIPELPDHYRGKVRDNYDLPDGRRITTRRVDDCFKDIEGIAHYQFRQLPGGDFQLRYVPELDGPESGDLRLLTERLESLFESAGSITTEAVDVLTPSPSGKFRLTSHT